MTANTVLRTVARVNVGVVAVLESGGWVAVDDIGAGKRWRLVTAEPLGPGSIIAKDAGT